MQCTKCGKSVTPDMKFCPGCGTLSSVPSPSSLASAETRFEAGSPVDQPSLASDKTTFGESTAEIEDLVGLTIANYTITEELGRGGMGVVYKAVHPLIGRTVAIKIISPLFSGSESFVARFKNEAVAMARLNHENIVSIENMGSHEGMYYLIMEYVPGKSLADILAEYERKSTRMPWREAVHLARQMLAALKLAHSRGMLHRDIKPGNILVKDDGGVRIADFGLVKIMGIGEEISVDEARSRMGTSVVSDAMRIGAALSIQGSPIGTFDYMSPEQHRGAADLDERTDIYSFGMTLYKMLTGRIARVRAKAPSRFHPDMLEMLDEICFTCLEEEREDRYRNADELLNALETIEQAVSNAHAELEEMNRKEERRKREEVARGPKPGQVKTINLRSGVSLDLAWIPPGEFTLGSPENELGRYYNETQHKVRLTNGFWMGVSSVTQAQWQTILGNNPSYFQNGENGAPSDTGAHPVEQVSWDDCQEFLVMLSRKTGQEFRLPTEAEWEYACRAGTSNALNSGKDLTTEDGCCHHLDEVAWYDENSAEVTHPVGGKKPNKWGLYDMHGNVWEWCQDWFGDYSNGTQVDPQGPSSGSGRVLRGGSWSYDAKDCRSAVRDSGPPGSRSYDGGFRIVLSASQD